MTDAVPIHDAAELARHFEDLSYAGPSHRLLQIFKLVKMVEDLHHLTAAHHRG